MGDSSKDHIEIPSVKTPVAAKDSAQVCFDITFQPINSGSMDAEALVFQNYYASSLSISQLLGPNKYVTILDRFELMKNPHTEENSQRWFSISSELFNNNYFKFKPMRITLFQPSTLWQKYEIRHFKAVSIPNGKLKHLDLGGSSSAGNSNGSSKISKNSSTDYYQGSFSLFIVHDLKQLNAACRSQRNMVDYPDPALATGDFSKRTTVKRQKEKKKDKRPPTASSTSLPSTGTSGLSSSSAGPVDNDSTSINDTKSADASDGIPT